jgi:hypothetical protein
MHSQGDAVPCSGDAGAVRFCVPGSKSLRLRTRRQGCMGFQGVVLLGQRALLRETAASVVEIRN